MKLEIGQYVKVTLSKNESDFGFVVDPKEVRFKIAKGNIAVNITKANSMMSKKGIYQFNASNVKIA